MGRIINEKNVKIIVDGLELLKKQLEILTPLHRNIFTSQETEEQYSLSDVQSLIDLLDSESKKKDTDE
jgi:hypothetical protein